MDGTAPKSTRDDPVVGESHEATDPKIAQDEIDVSNPSLEGMKGAPKQQSVSVVAAAAEGAAEDLPVDANDEVNDIVPLLRKEKSMRFSLSVTDDVPPDGQPSDALSQGRKDLSKKPFSDTAKDAAKGQPMKADVEGESRDTVSPLGGRQPSGAPSTAGACGVERPRDDANQDDENDLKYKAVPPLELGLYAHVPRATPRLLSGKQGRASAPEGPPLDEVVEDDCKDGTPLLTLQGAANGSVATVLSDPLLLNIPGGAGASSGADPRGPMEQKIDRNKATPLRRADSVRPPGAAIALHTPAGGPLNYVDVSSGPQGAAAVRANGKNTDPLEKADSMRPLGAARAPEAPPLSLPRTNFYGYSPMIAQDSASTVSDMSFRGLGMISEYSVETNREKDEPGSSFIQPVEIRGALRREPTSRVFDLHRLAQEFEQQGKYSEAEPLYLQAGEIWQQSLGLRHPVVGDILNKRVVMLTKQGKLKESKDLSDRALKLVSDAVGERHKNYAAVLNGQAELLRAQGKYKEAESLCRRVLEIWEESLGPEHPNVAVASNNLAELLRAQGSYDAADPLYRRALDIDENQYGPDSPEVAADLNNRAELLRAQGNILEAEAIYARVREVWERALGPEHPYVATVLGNQAELLADQEKYGEAEYLNMRALEINERVFGPDHPAVATDLNNRAWLLECRGERAEAEALYERSQAIRERALGDVHPAVADSLNNRAILLAEQESFEEAGPIFSRAISIYESVFGKEHPLADAARENLAIASERQRRKQIVPLRRRFSRSEKKLSRTDSNFSRGSYGSFSRLSTHSA